MEIQFNVTGSRRKALAQAVGQHIVAAPEYLGAPTFAYSVGGLTIDRNGALIGEASPELLASLAERGFEHTTVQETDQCQSSDALTIELPGEGFTDLAIDNLNKLIESKASLIKKALGTDSVPVIQSGDTLQFPWLGSDASAELVDASTRFIAALCDRAKELRRVTAQEKEVENEKYAFRCFLLRLGFIGGEYKGVRKILLENLDGDAAFKQPPAARRGTNIDDLRGERRVEVIPPITETVG